MPDKRYTDINSAAPSSNGIADFYIKRAIDAAGILLRLHSKLLNELLADVKALLKKKDAEVPIKQLIEGNGIEIKNMLGGRYQIATKAVISGLSTKGGNSASGVIPAKIVSKDGAYYLVDLYEDGFDEDPTEEDVTAQILMLNYADELPANTKVLVAKNYVDSTEGGE